MDLKLMHKITSSFMTALLTGCASISEISDMATSQPGHVSVTTSKLDRERQVNVLPGWLYAGGLKYPVTQLGGFWTDKHPDIFIIEAATSCGEDIDGLKISLDGEIVELKPAGPPSARSRFEVPLPFIDRMLAADKVVVQFLLSHHGTADAYVEGIFSFNQTTYARPAFVKAMSKIRASIAAKPGGTA